MLPARSFLFMPPAAIFLSAAKEIWKRTPPKTDGFWISSCSPAATAQKDPQRIAPASILAAAYVAHRGQRRTHRFRRSSNRARAADSGTCRCAPLATKHIFTTINQRTSARNAGAAAIRGPQTIRRTTICTVLGLAWYTATFSSTPQPRRKS